MNLALTAWLLENTDDQDDYLRITTKIKTVSQVVGHVLALALTQYVENGTFISSGLYCVIGAVSVGLIFRIGRRGVTKQVPAQPPILPSVRIAVNSRLFRKLISSYTWLLAGRDVVGVSLLFLFQCEDYPEIQNYKEFAQWFVYLTLISTSIGVLSALLLSRQLKTLDKYYCYRVVIYTYITMAAIMLPCTMIRTSGSFAVVFSLVCLFAILNTCVDILRDMMTRDLLIADYYSTGMHREAMYLTVVSTPLNVVRALISALPLLVIPLSGYHQNNAVDDDTLANKVDYNVSTLWLARLMTCAYLFFAPAALYCILNYQITDAKIKFISAQIEQEEEQEQDGSDGGDGDGDVVAAVQASLDGDLLTTALNDSTPPPRKVREMGHSSDSGDKKKNYSLSHSKRSPPRRSGGDEEDKHNMSFHVSALSDFVVTLLNLSPVENRALASAPAKALVPDNDATATAAVLNVIGTFVNAQLLLSVVASTMLMALFITVTVEGHQTWAFLIVFLFLVTSMSALYSFYRYQALQLLTEQHPGDICDAAMDTERQRLNDKRLHVLLAEVEGNPRSPSNIHLGSDIGSDTDGGGGDDVIPNPVVLPSSPPPAPASPSPSPSPSPSASGKGQAEGRESYRQDNYIAENLLFCGALVGVIAVATAAFGLRL
jgi:Na+/melibiose symporter-like transporter